LHVYSADGKNPTFCFLINLFYQQGEFLWVKVTAVRFEENSSVVRMAKQGPAK